MTDILVLYTVRYSQWRHSQFIWHVLQWITVWQTCLELLFWMENAVTFISWLVSIRNNTAIRPPVTKILFLACQKSHNILRNQPDSWRNRFRYQSGFFHFLLDLLQSFLNNKLFILIIWDKFKTILISFLEKTILTFFLFFSLAYCILIDI